MKTGKCRTAVELSQVSLGPFSSHTLRDILNTSDAPGVDIWNSYLSITNISGYVGSPCQAMKI